MTEFFDFQLKTNNWMLHTFGTAVARDKSERCHRLLEETLELVQSLGCIASEAHQLVDYVFGRPVGEPEQELGGTMVCLAALANAAYLNLDNAAEAELARCWQNVEKIRAKWKTKPKHSPLPATEVKDDIIAIRDIIKPHLDLINSTPELYSLLYAGNMLPEQTVTIIGAIRLACLCDVWKRMADAESRAAANAGSVPHVVINEEAHGQ